MIRPLFNWISFAWYWIFPDAVGFLMLMVMFVHLWETILRPLWRTLCSQCPQLDFQQSALHSRITCLVWLVLNLLIRTQFLYSFENNQISVRQILPRWRVMIYGAYFLPLFAQHGIGCDECLGVLVFTYSTCYNYCYTSS